MAKKYYWLKLQEDFFDDDTISWIEEQENGRDYCLFYLKLCLKSLQSDGILIRVVGETLIPYDPKKLAEITRTDIDTVLIAMELFKKIGLIDILDNGEIYLKQLSELVGSETDTAKRVRNHRIKKKMLQCNTDETKCNIEIEIEKEKEKELDKKKRFVPPSVDDVKSYVIDKKLNIDAVSFFNYYTENNWHDMNNKKIKNWKLKAQTWHNREKKNKNIKKDIADEIW